MKPLIASAVAASMLAGTASATTLQSSAGASRGAAVDPDARFEALAAAASRGTGTLHGRPSKTDRGILKNDPQLRAAFAWLDNK